MRPILLKGHERSITQVKYNRDGDLLFSASKANFPCVWFSNSGERLGTYTGHNGTIWSLDINYDTTRVLTASADRSAKMWDAELGKEILHLDFKSPGRWIEFAEGDKQFLVLTDAVMNQTSTIHVFDTNDSADKAYEIVLDKQHKLTQAVWGPMGQTIITTAEDGTIRVYDVSTRKQINEVKHHTKAINRLVMDKHRLFFLTASKDSTAKLYDAKNLDLLKSYETGRPVNGASISPLKEHIIVGGGQSAEGVTTSSSDSSQFRVRFFHKILGDELGSVPGHFGPVNTLSFSPDGRAFASGGEDGYVRVHHFDPSYFNSK